jgi:hypothetical protein
MHPIIGVYMCIMYTGIVNSVIGWALAYNSNVADLIPDEVN